MKNTLPLSHSPTLPLFNLILFYLISFQASGQLKVFSGGNISIGNIATPYARLHVYGNCIFSDNTFVSGTPTSAALIRGLGNFSGPNEPDYCWWGDDGTGIFHPGTNFIGFSINGSESMRISERSNLIIGGTYESDFRLKVDGGRNQTTFGTFTDFNYEYGYAHIAYNNNSLTKNWAVEYNEREQFYVLSNGEVWANRYNTLSDSTLKENIHKLVNSKNRILQLRGVSYNYKPEILHNQLDTTTILPIQYPSMQIGLIAQEVEQIVPEVVSTNDHGLKGISYSNLTALLIEAFKEQNQTIDSLRNQIADCCKSKSFFRTANTENNSSKTGAARLDQNIPNPFNTETKISFYIPESAASKYLFVFNMEGTLIKEYPISNSGESFLKIAGGEYKPGMYLYSLIIDGKEIDTKRMILTN